MALCKEEMENEYSTECVGKYKEKYEISEDLGKNDCCTKDDGNQDADELAKRETYKIMQKHLFSPWM